MSDCLHYRADVVATVQGEDGLYVTERCRDCGAIRTLHTVVRLEVWQHWHLEGKEPAPEG